MKVWRYLDLAKFTFLLQKAELHCPRGDQFEDIFEGSYPAKNLMDFEGFGFNCEEWKKYVAISCWHQSEHESDAMWKFYGLNKNSVAITTTYEYLEDLADKYGGYVKPVEYIDFILKKANINIPTDVFHYKRLAFKHESEVRIIKPQYPHCGFTDGYPNLAVPTEGKELHEFGLFFEVELEEFIHKIVISPYADQWFFDVVASLCGKYNLDAKRVEKSELSGDPIYSGI